MNNTKWPKTLWILTEDNIKKGGYGSGDRRCLGAWCVDQFTGQYHAARDIFAKKLRKNLVKIGSAVPVYHTVPYHNDRGGLSLDELAQAWNMTLADFGYVEIDKSEWKDYE